jgi:hypothetical protein
MGQLLSRKSTKTVNDIRPLLNGFVAYVTENLLTIVRRVTVDCGFDVSLLLNQEQPLSSYLDFQHTSSRVRVSPKEVVLIHLNNSLEKLIFTFEDVIQFENRLYWPRLSNDVAAVLLRNFPFMTTNPREYSTILVSHYPDIDGRKKAFVRHLVNCVCMFDNDAVKGIFESLKKQIELRKEIDSQLAILEESIKNFVHCDKEEEEEGIL